MIGRLVLVGTLLWSLTGSLPVTLVMPGAALAASHVATQPIPLPPALAPIHGQDLWHIDMDTGQFIQDTSGHVHLYLRDAPVGTPDTSGWRFRDPSLSKRGPDGSFVPAALPFSVNIAPNTGTSYLASIVNEGGATLQVGFVNPKRTTPAPMMGRVAGSKVVYASPRPAAFPDLAVWATDSGLSIQVVLRNARQSADVRLRLTLPAGASLKRVSSGSLLVMRTLISEPGTIGPEYVIEQPVTLDAASGATTIAHASLAPISFGALVAGTQDVTVTPDSAWLHDRSRRFPATLTIPIVTALAASETGVFTTDRSCIHTDSRLLTDMIVGVSGSCSYQGQLFFALPPMLPSSTIISATLGLYAPDQRATTGVRVFMNAPPALPFVAPSALDQPAGSVLPAVDAHAAGVSEEGSGSSWHTWDVTTIVRRWLGDRRTNGGLTLRGRGKLVRFAWPLDAGTGSGQTAPLLSIVFG